MKLVILLIAFALISPAIGFADSALQTVVAKDSETLKALKSLVAVESENGLRETVGDAAMSQLKLMMITETLKSGAAELKSQTSAAKLFRLLVSKAISDPRLTVRGFLAQIEVLRLAIAAAEESIK